MQSIQYLNKARGSLEDYVRGPRDEVLLQQALDELRQWEDTLAELPEICLLIQAMRTALQFEAEAWPTSTKLMETVALGFLILEIYVERLTAGQQRTPWVLWPCGNQLRFLIGKKSISAAEYYAKTTVMTLPREEPPAAMLQTEPVRKTAHRLRAAFQAALLAWLKYKDADQGLGELIRLTQQLREQSREAHARAFWWIVKSYLEGLQVQAIADDEQTKHLLSQIEQQVRRQAGQDEDEFVIELPHELEAMLLFCIGQRQFAYSGSEAIDQVFALSRWLPSQAQIDDEIRMTQLISQQMAQVQLLKQLQADVDDLVGRLTRHDDVDSSAEFVGLRADLHRTAMLCGFLGYADNQAALAVLATGPSQTADAYTRELALLKDKLVEALADLALAQHQAPVLPDATVMQDVDALLTAADAEEIIISMPQDYAEASQPEPVDEGDPSLARMEHAWVPDLVTDNQILLPAVRAENADEEILAIFIEEAEEILADLRQDYAHWRDTDDGETRVKVRRAFHTLKGSGRMAGASLIAEFAWAHENLLNRLLEQSLTDQQAVLKLIGIAIDLMPALIAQLKGQTQGAIDSRIIGLLTRVQLLAPLPIKTNAGKSSIEQPRTELPSTLPKYQEQPVPCLDAELYAIFMQECQAHLRVLEQLFISQQRKATPDQHQLQRTLHTLTGSAGTVGAQSIVLLAQPLEHLVKLLDVSVIMADHELLALFQSSTQAITAELDRLGDTHLPALDHGQLLTRLQQALTSAHAHHQALESKPDKGDPVNQVDDFLLGVFLDEAAELLSNLEAALHQWRHKPSDSGQADAWLRDLHTLKGGARMVGLQPIAELAHECENLLKQIRDEKHGIDDVGFELLLRTLDQFMFMLEQARQGRVVICDQSLLVAMSGCRAELPAMDITGAAAPDEPESINEAWQAPFAETTSSLAQDTQAHTARPVEPAANESAVGAKTTAETTAPAIRISALLLDVLLNHAGEMSIYHGQLEQQVGGWAEHLNEFDRTVTRLRRQLRELELETEAQILYRHTQTHHRPAREEFDPLELDQYTHVQQLSRTISESVADLSSLRELFGLLQGETENLLQQQAQVNAELRSKLTHARMVPFSSQAVRFDRIVRQTAQTLGKSVELVIQGGDEEIDRKVLEHMVNPIEHMLRNAVSHGLEAGDERRRLGKSELGNIQLRVRREGAQVVIEVADDGAGLDLAAIRRKATERGLLPPGIRISDQDLAQFILEPGFSTAAQITQIAGRGVGLDVVDAQIKHLGGALSIESQAGVGSCFKARLPYSLAVGQVLLVRTAHETYAIPVGTVNGVIRLSEVQTQDYQRGSLTSISYDGVDYSLRLFADLVALPAQPQVGAHGLPLLLIRSGDQRCALVVDKVLGRREIMVKPSGPQLQSLRGITGVTILNDSQVVLIIDPVALMRNFALHRQMTSETKQEDRIAKVMVVDDSITVRRVSARLLERYGLEVITARDGMEAISLLQQTQPDLMLLDVEMPRMDGYELAQYIRSNASLRHLPIIMITSRMGDKHRERALTLGVNEYLGKPYQEAELLQKISRLLNQAGKSIAELQDVAIA
jgi:chemosensory pili system protein ChpA (sensor histidine kinase/response regulator)